MRISPTLLAAAAMIGCNGKAGPTLTVGASSVEVRPLRTRAERDGALLRYGGADPYVPLLLAYPRDRIQHLHTLGVRRSFDAVFISREGTVVDARTLKRHDETGITSSKPAAYTLLLPEGGWAATGLAEGATITLPAMKAAQDLPVIRFENKKAVLHVELVLNAAQRRRGLMYRTALSDDEGMLFKYPRPETSGSGFWMKNTRIPLSIAFFNEDGRIITIHPRMEPENETKKYPPTSPAQYALEVNAGWFQRHGIGRDVRVILEASIREARAKVLD